jgi:hypothetical protein
MSEEVQPETAAPPAATPRAPSHIMRWTGNFVLGGALILIVLVVVAATLARYGLIDKLAGFMPFYLSLNPARALTAIGLVALIIALVRKSGGVAKLALGTVLAGVLTIAIYAMLVIPRGNAPRLHDITTDVDDPPKFQTLALREDNLVPFESEEEWRAAHRQGYSDLAPILIERAPEEVLASARALAEERGWEIAAYDAATGHMEATATAGYIRFHDDVIVEVTPVADGSTRVDMRSVSRVGLSDLGVNAMRIREFLAALQAAG